MPKFPVLAVLALIAVVLLGCSDAATPTPAAPDADSHLHDPATSEALILSPAARQAAGLLIDPAAAATLTETLALYGVIQANAERVRTVGARFPGVVLSVTASLGDTVRAGQQLATVESNDSLQAYAVNSPLAGIISARHVNPGEQVDGRPLFTVADLSSVWAELALYPRDRGRIQLGQQVRISADGRPPALAEIGYLSPWSSTGTQSLSARVLLDNRDGRWTPGLFVQAHVQIGQTAVALAVPVAALQELDHGTSVFVEEADGFHPRRVVTGRSDGRQVEIVDGLQPGEAVVGEGSFVLKAELGKGEAEHAH